jgi:hypothetical protein
MRDLSSKCLQCQLVWSEVGPTMVRVFRFVANPSPRNAITPMAMAQAACVCAILSCASIVCVSELHQGMACCMNMGWIASNEVVNTISMDQASHVRT